MRMKVGTSSRRKTISQSLTPVSLSIRQSAAPPGSDDSTVFTLSPRRRRTTAVCRSGGGQVTVRVPEVGDGAGDRKSGHSLPKSLWFVHQTAPTWERVTRVSRRRPWTPRRETLTCPSRAPARTSPVVVCRVPSPGLPLTGPSTSRPVVPDPL